MGLLSPQVSPRIQCHQKSLTALVDHKLVVLGEESVDRFHGPGAKFRKGRMPVHAGVFNNEVVADLNEWAVGNHLVVDEWSVMIRIQDHHGTAAADRVIYVRDNGRIGTRPRDISDPRVLRTIQLRLDIDRNYSTVTELIENHCDEERASSTPRSGLNNHIGAGPD